MGEWQTPVSLHPARYPVLPDPMSRTSAGIYAGQDSREVLRRSTRADDARDVLLWQDEDGQEVSVKPRSRGC